MPGASERDASFPPWPVAMPGDLVSDNAIVVCVTGITAWVPALCDFPPDPGAGAPDAKEREMDMLQRARKLSVIIMATVVLGSQATAEPNAVKTCKDNSFVGISYNLDQNYAMAGAKLSWRGKVDAAAGHAWDHWPNAAEATIGCEKPSMLYYCRAVARPCRWEKAEDQRVKQEQRVQPHHTARQQHSVRQYHSVRHERRIGPQSVLSQQFGGIGRHRGRGFGSFGSHRGGRFPMGFASGLRVFR